MKSEIEKHPTLDTALSAISKLKPSQFELYLSKTAKLHIEARDGAVETLTQAEDLGLAVRVIHNRRQGFSFTTSMEKAAIERAVQSAFEMTEVMPEDPFAELGRWDGVKYPSLDLRDDEGLQAPTEKKVALALELESLCRRIDTRIKGVRSASVGQTFSQVCIVDSNAQRISAEETLFTSSIACRAEQDGESQMGGDFGFSHELARLNLDTVAKMGAQTALELLGAKAAPTLQCPAVLRNNVVAELIDFLSASFSAEQIDKGRSLLQGKHGQKLFATKLNLIDDGVLKSGLASGSFDAEGVPCQTNHLIRNGVYETALYDRYYAKKKGAKPSGVSGRGIKSPPATGVTNLFIPNGTQSLSALQSSIDRGVMITDLMGLHTANPVTGDFSLGASGFLIEKGKPVYPIKGFAVAGNLLQLLNRITDIGNDQRFFGNVGAPSVFVSELSVGGT
jgi:PmbA protein